MVKLIIFESTDVLIDSTSAKGKSVSVVVDFLARNGITVTARSCGLDLDKSKEYVAHAFGLDSSVHDFDRLTLGHLLEKHRVRLSVVDFESLLRAFHEAQVENAKLHSDVAVTLSGVKGKAKLCLIAEGPSWKERKLVSKLGLSGLFSERFYSEEFGFNKSADALFKHVLDVFDVVPSEVVLVTSNVDRDVASANRFGICTVLVDRSGKVKLSSLAIRPKFLVRSLKEISKLPL